MLYELDYAVLWRTKLNLYEPKWPIGVVLISSFSSVEAVLHESTCNDDFPRNNIACCVASF